MRLPKFSETFAFLFGLWMSVAASYAIARQSREYARSLPARISAESVAGFQSIFFARTRQAYPPSGTEVMLPGVRWRVRYAAPAGDTLASPARVTVVAESVPDGYASEYSFERRLP